ncbi:MAG: hypothetical protein Q7V09_20830 [Hydrogenophaga sp.]|uniref:hypothetical protein n=1 Tax=Hydrogenophaga sp. TaxID=1904254 RepID=UPI002721A3F2|nr:hypothetical protein [Hydrogenophaga sp.]MDO9032880.1 hypothetical protein [Hydrogenophaga sp.]
MNTTNQQAKGLNLTPAIVSNWGTTSKADVLIVNPDAILHQRAALAWSMAFESLNLLEAGQLSHGSYQGNDKAVLCVAIERMHQITTLLQDIGDRTAALEGGFA